MKKLILIISLGMVLSVRADNIQIKAITDSKIWKMWTADGKTDAFQVNYTSNGHVIGVYIIEVEGTKYIVNVAGGIVKHEPADKK